MQTKTRRRFVSSQMPLCANHVFLCVIDPGPATSGVGVAVLLVVISHGPSHDGVVPCDRVSPTEDVVVRCSPNSTGVETVKVATFAAYKHD